MNRFNALRGIIKQPSVEETTVKYADDSVGYFRNGVRYKFERPDGYQEWSIDGKLHRVNGPAVIYKNYIDYGRVRREWWYEGQRHRIGGPALIDGDYKEWWVHGEMHRDDGPAITDGRKNRAWCLNGKRITKKEFEEKTRKPVVLKNRYQLLKEQNA